MSSPIIACPPEWRAEALRVLYAPLTAPVRDQLVADALAEADAGRVDLSGLFVARRRGRIIGTLLTQPLAGRAAAVWPPEVAAVWGRGAIAAALVRQALADLQARGIRIAQALVDVAAPRAAGDLARGGLPRITALTYMERPTDRPDARSPVPDRPGYRWRPFDEATAGAFRDALRATYEGSLDMPELDGIRSLDDVIASHRAAGRFDPSRWRLGEVEGEPGSAAVLLLAEVPDRLVWEVAYLGLTPPARGRGLGRLALRHALDLARPHVARLELAVDDRNVPARRLYDAAGFAPFDRRLVHLAILNGDGNVVLPTTAT